MKLIHLNKKRISKGCFEKKAINKEFLDYFFLKTSAKVAFQRCEWRTTIAVLSSSTRGHRISTHVSPSEQLWMRGGKQFTT